jgi:hypothetical protein
MGLSAALIVPLGGCLSIYSPPWGWAVAIDQTKCPSRADTEKAAAQAFDKRFRLELTACVAAFDPTHLYEMDTGGVYQISGWFVSAARTALVQGCMTRKGWQPFPL